MPERSYENTWRGQKVGWAGPCHSNWFTELRTGNDYTFLMLIHWFKIGCMITIYLGNQVQVEPSPSERFSHINCGNSTVRKVKLRDSRAWVTKKGKNIGLSSSRGKCRCMTVTSNSDQYCPVLSLTPSLTVSVQNKLTTYNRLRLLGMEQKNNSMLS